MFSQFFGNYLLEKQKITSEQFDACIQYIKEKHTKLGLIAEMEGMLTAKQATELNYLQMQSDKRFGALAIEKGYLTPSDVAYLLSRQSSPYLRFIQALRENDILSQESIHECVAAFQKENNFSDATMKAIQEGNITDMLLAFVQTDDSRYNDLIGLTLRNIIRFVNSFLRIGKGTFVSSVSAKYAAFQRTTGDYNGFLGFYSDDDDILAIADGYAKESFGTVDEDALDSVGEFTNCVNGLYAAELSYQNVQIDMQPPEMLFDATIASETSFYSLPLYVEGKKSNLIIKLG